MFNDWLRQQAAELKIDLNRDALQQFERYAQLLQEWNQSLNLTTIDTTPEVYELHFLDSLSVALALDVQHVDSLIDVGTGAGFPGLVLAIALPTIRVTLLESIRKKARFLQTAVAEFGLDGRVEVICERAETIGQQAAYREQYDVAVARAVARLVVLAEYCLPLVRVGGCFIAQKGSEIETELAEATHCSANLGGGEAKLLTWSLPSAAERTLIRVDKHHPCPAKYPRRPGIPAKRPLL